MKRIFTFLSLALCMMTAGAQQNYKVGTEEQTRNILLEEFTGIHCAFCPEGHRISEEMMNGFRGQMHLVNLHAGPYSSDREGENFTCPDGEKLYEHFQPSSFPAGLINRHVFQQDTYVYGRDGWPYLYRRIMDEKAPVNLYLESAYDDESRRLTVHVEGYSVADNSGADMRLSVLFTQDYMEGIQFGVPDINHYVHMNVLRDYISAWDGDPIGQKAEGEYFTADYTYDMPEKIGGMTVVPGNINVVAFVTTGGLTEIANVTSGKPSYTGMHTDADAVLLAPEMEMTARYGFNFFEAEIRNKCAEHVTEASFEVETNGTVEQVGVQCDVQPFSTAAVRVPAHYAFDAAGKVSYRVRLTAINGMAVQPTELKGEFMRPQTVNGDVRVVISTDRSIAETIYLLKDEDGNIIRQFGPYPDKSGKQYEEFVELNEEKTYCVEAYDYFGNGVFTGKKATVTIFDGQGSVVEEADAILGFGTRLFFTLDKGLGIEGITAGDAAGGATFTIGGIRTDGSRGGIIIRNGKKYIGSR